VLDGVVAIQAGDNPRVIQEKLAGYLAPAKGKKAAKGASAAAPSTSPAKAGA
jgi:flagellar motor component MotA